MRASERAYDSMIAPGINGEASFRCNICGGTNLELLLGDYRNPLMARLNCRSCDNYRDWIATSEKE